MAKNRPYGGSTALVMGSRQAAHILTCALLVGCFSTAEDSELRSTQRDLEQRVTDATDEAEVARAVAIGTSVQRKADTVEVTLHSERPFEVGAMPAVLVIGERAFGRSYFGDDGDLKTLVFVLDAREFDELPEAAQISFGHLDPAAELPDVPPDARGAARSPRIRPDQVKGRGLRLGALRKSQLEISE